MNYDECLAQLIGIVREFADEHNEGSCEEDTIDDAAILVLADEIRDFVARNWAVPFGPPPRPGVLYEKHASISDMVQGK